MKTRLSEILPSPAVTALYRCLLEDTLGLAKALPNVEVVVMCPEADEEELAEWLGDSIRIVEQNGNGLAAGLDSVFRRFTAPTGTHVIAFNSDSPHLAPAILQGAFDKLARHDLVVGPTHDGGYYLVGAKTAHSSLFEGDGLGTRSALDRLLARATALGLSMGFTERFYDIDIAEDLIRLRGELQLDPARAPRTAAWFAEWEHAVAQIRVGNL